MKQLLRRIFFWDAPARGAFFTLTLLFMLPKFVYTLGIGIILPLFLHGGSTATLSLFCLPAMIGVVVLNALVAYAHFVPKKPMGRKEIVIAICVCSALMLGFWRIAPDEFRRWGWTFLLAFGVFGHAYSFRSTTKVWEWIVACATLSAGIVSYCALNVAEVHFLAKPFFPQTGVFHIITESPWLLWLLSIICILMLTAAYLMLGRIVAKEGGVTFRSLFGRGVVTLWIVFAITYLASICMAFCAMHDYRKAQKELADYWGFSVNNKTLLELYEKSGTIDQSFWNEANSLQVIFPEFYKKYDGIDIIVGTTNAVLPPDIHAEWKAAFNGSAELRRREEMFDAPPPLAERRVNFDFDNFHFDMFAACRATARLELWRVKFTLDDNDIASAKKALRRFDNISSPLVADYNEVSGMVWMAIEPMRATALCNILSSGLADEEWLREQSAILLEKERIIPDVHKRMILGHAACMIYTLDSFIEHSSYATLLFSPESWVLLVREGAALARCHRISDFSDFPEHPNGIFARMLSSGLRHIGTKSFKKHLATLRVSRGLVDAELSRLKTGAYLAAMDNLPEDPFSGKPLLYLVGDCEITEEHFQLSDNNEGEDNDEMIVGMTKEVQQQLGLTDEQMAKFSRRKKYTFKTERRTVKAVQIWSVGSDGVSGDTEGDSRHSRDDIRFIVPIRKEECGEGR